MSIARKLVSGSVYCRPIPETVSLSPRTRQRLPKAMRKFAFMLSLVFIASSAFAAVSIDTTTSKDRSWASTRITTPAFSTTAGQELLLAFIATDGNDAGMTVQSVTGAGLTWVLVKRSNGQLGTSEIWRAFATAPLTNVSVSANLSQSVAASISVVSFKGVDTSGTNGSGAIGAVAGNSASSGAPQATLV